MDDNHGHSHDHPCGHCHDHDEHHDDHHPENHLIQSHPDSNQASNKRRLWTALSFCTIFMLVEFLGGFFSHSLALMSDAAHMLTDVVSYGISIAAILLGERPPNALYPYGYGRAQVLGALASLVLTWGLTLLLVIEAFVRMVQPNNVDGKLMLIVSVCGLFGNIVMLIVLRGHEDLHSHHGQRCTHHHDTCHHEEESAFPTESSWYWLFFLPRNHNINMRAAMLHVIGDTLQTLAVLISSIVIWAAPSARIIDPICVLVFCGAVMLTSVPVARDVFRILMQAQSLEVDIDEMRHQIMESVEGVSAVDSIHCWALTSDQHVVTVKVIVREDYTSVSGVSVAVEDVCRGILLNNSRTTQSHVVIQARYSH